MPDSIFTFFGLRENPFRINPDPHFLFVTDQARATADELVYAVRNRKGLILLTGEVGTGKTMLVRRLLDWLAEQKMPTALVFNSRIHPEHLLDFILHDFGVHCDSPVKSDKLMALNRWLLERYRAGQLPVLVVDEAQGLAPETLEEVRLLLNFETPRDKLLQVVLAGQPELETKLKRHELRQLRQRITIRCRTSPLTVEQTGGYIQHRLRVAGAAQDNIFEPAAIAAVHAHSHGIPRVINVLCEHALINACADGSRTVSLAAVDQAARECQLDRVESVQRILQTGSYSAAELRDEISSILRAVASRGSFSAAPAHPRTGVASAPAAPPPPPRTTQPYLSAYERSFPNARLETGPLAEPVSAEPESILSPLSSRVASSPASQPAATTSLNAAGAAAAPARAPISPTAEQSAPEIETIALPDTGASVSRSAIETAPQDVEVRASAEAASVSGSRASDREILREAVAAARMNTPRRPENFRELLAFWGSGFARDARTTSRAVRRFVRSLEVSYWKPFARAVGHEARQLETRIVRFLSDPRWAQRWNALDASVNRQWHAAKTAAASKLERLLGAEQGDAGPNTEAKARGARARVARSRAVLTLRRWLREPMTSQGKSAHRHHRTA